MTKVMCYIFEPCEYRDSTGRCSQDYIELMDESVQENCCESWRPPVPDEREPMQTPEEHKQRMDEQAKAVAEKIMTALRKGSD